MRRWEEDILIALLEAALTGSPARGARLQPPLGITAALHFSRVATPGDGCLGEQDSTI